MTPSVTYQDRRGPRTAGHETTIHYRTYEGVERTWADCSCRRWQSGPRVRTEVAATRAARNHVKEVTHE
jgi:hypothetical protein